MLKVTGLARLLAINAFSVYVKGVIVARKKGQETYRLESSLTVAEDTNCMLARMKIAMAVFLADLDAIRGQAAQQIGCVVIE